MKYILLVKKSKRPKVLCLKTETVIANPGKYVREGYLVHSESDIWSEAQDTLRRIKAGESIDESRLGKINGHEVVESPPPRLNWKVPKKYSHYVYALYGADDSLLYIGVTNRPLRRTTQHYESGKKFKSLDVLFGFNDRVEAESFEVFSIFHKNPPLNRLRVEEHDEFTHSPRMLDKF